MCPICMYIIHTGVGSIGKCIFHACDPPEPERSAEVMIELERLEKVWRRRMEELRAVELEFQSVAIPPYHSSSSSLLSAGGHQPDRAAAVSIISDDVGVVAR